MIVVCNDKLLCKVEGLEPKVAVNKASLQILNELFEIQEKLSSRTLFTFYAGKGNVRGQGQLTISPLFQEYLKNKETYRLTDVQQKYYEIT